MKILILLVLLIVGKVYAFQPEKNEIFIYHGPGVSEESFQQAFYTVHKLTPSYKMQQITFDEISQKKWINHAALLVIPGGRDLPYVQYLSGQNTDIIKDYIKNGGSFLGLCAGAYFASGSIEFDKNGPLKVIGERNLALFPGKSIGPILAPYDYRSCSGCRAAKINWLENSSTNYFYYNGGGYFKNAEKYPNVKVLAQYKDKIALNLPAVIQIKYGSGNVILSGVHFEYAPELLKTDSKNLKNIIKNINSTNQTRLKIVKDILLKLGVF